MIEFRVIGDFKRTRSKLARLKNFRAITLLNKYGRKGVEELANLTPKDTGETSRSWSYNVTNLGNGNYRINWTNSNVNQGLSIALLLQYGHGTRGGTYVPGRDYINPAIRPVIEQLADDLRREVFN